MDSQFIFVTCQVGGEQTIKNNLVGDGLRLAFSRPGFLTFKLPQPQPPFESLGLTDPFIRSFGLCMGKVRGETDENRACGVWDHIADLPFDQLHVWPRDQLPAGQHNFDPGLNDASHAARKALYETASQSQRIVLDRQSDDHLARRNDRVLDCIVVDPKEWWIGTHRVDRWIQRWPGGFWFPDSDVKMISRAYLKMSEALAWVAWPIKPGQRCVELGCAPGGASQALLEHGLRVVGIDPAVVDPQIDAHPHFQHLRKRSGDVRIRAFQEFQWLTADMNLDPRNMLDEVERIVCHRANRIWGVILTVKLHDWSLAQEIPSYLERIRSWGYPRVRARQLSHNRQEVCVVGLRPRPKTRRRSFARPKR